MLLLAKGNGAQNIVVTLTEKVTIADPIYLFVFTAVTSKKEIRVFKTTADDTSTATARYNEFTLEVDTLFTVKDPGQWQYIVFQTDVTDPDQVTDGLVELENGKMQLTRKTVTVKSREATTTYKTYGG